MKVLSQVTLFFISFLYVGEAGAEFISLPDPGLQAQVESDYASGGARDRSFIYVVPNEIHPEEAQPILNKATSGVHVSVGADRGFIGAALNQASTHLLLVDLSPEVIFYNQVNITLLKASKSLDDYLYLRSAGSYASWKEALTIAELNEKDKKILGSEAIFKRFSSYQKPATDRLLQPEWFKGSSYLKDPELFSKIQKMAKDEKIQVAQGNLNDENFLKSIGKALKEKDIPISVLDISNAWDYKYTGSGGVKRIISNLSEAMKERSILLVSHARQKLDDHIYHWDMYGYTKEALEEVEKKVGSPSAMYSLVKSEKFRTRSSLLELKDISYSVIQTTKWADILKDSPDFLGATIRKLVTARNCVFGAPKCELPKTVPPPLSEIKPSSEMRLILWQPEGYDFSFILPQRPGESPEGALEAYLKSIERIPEMKKFANPLREVGSGVFGEFPLKSKEPIALGLNTARGFFIDDTVAKPKRMHRILDPMIQRGSKAYLLPAGITLGMSDNDAEKFRNLLSSSVDIVFAPGGSDIHPRFYGEDVHFAAGINEQLDKDQLGTVRHLLDQKEGAFFVGICRGIQMGSVAAECPLVQDIEKEIPNSEKHTPRWKLFGSSHEIEKLSYAIEEGSFTDRVFRGDRSFVTEQSRHHEAVKNQPNDRFKPTAVNPHDGVVEFAEFKNKWGRTTGVGAQFHFEREQKTDFSRRIYQTAYEEAQLARDRRLSRLNIDAKPRFLKLEDCARDFSKLATKW